MIQSLALQHFRIYSSKTFTFSQPTTVIVGPNAIGKTSILEAISLLSTGHSFRADRVEEMIAFEQELGRIKSKVRSVKSIAGDDPPDQEEVTLEVLLTRGEVQGKRTLKTLYSVNDVRRRKKDFLGHFYTVLFRPEDMRLVEGSPSRRRRFLDVPLSILDHEYAHSLTAYEQTLKRRNKLLELVREQLSPETALTYWNMSLIKHGQKLQQSRQAFLHSFNSVEFPLSFSVEYQPSLISEDRIKQYQKKEVVIGHTLIGPHKDDFIVKLKVGKHTAESTDVAIYGSRGQQRMAVLWLKIGELAYVESTTGTKVTLLLDDILSELDQESRQRVMTLLGERQTIITTTEPRVVEEIESVSSQLDIIALE
ncbi:MAG TPA: DNA replication and repair protein RecF [Patescibacteria group bacterium]